MDDIITILNNRAGLDNTAIEKAVQASKTDGTGLMEALEKLNLVEDQLLLEIFSEYLGIQHVDLSTVEINPNILTTLDSQTARKYNVLPFDRSQGKLVVATGNPRELEAMDAVRFKTGISVKPVLASPLKIRGLISKYYGSVSIGKVPKSSSLNTASTPDTNIRRTLGGVVSKDDGPVKKFVDDVLLQCIETGASDIHFECYEESVRVRLRIDGELKKIAELLPDVKSSMITRFKIISSLDIAENRKPQDGAINDLVMKGRPIDFRVSTIPTVFGEKIVLRVLDKSNLQVDMTQLGFDDNQLAQFQQAISSPFGMVVVTGPTGSGKTTTLYSALQELNKETSNVMTAEDPVEYSLPGINQVQVKPEIGFGFAEALRAFLRQDPDIILVGEIRDLETAEIAMKASLTGHMVLSTLHTNSAADTISRLLDMGVEPFNIVSALNCVSAQRLMRTNCPRCLERDPEVTIETIVELGIHPGHAAKVQPMRGKGCASCGGTGQKGRTAVHEVMVLTDVIKRGILSGLPATDIKSLAMNNGMRSLRQSALAKMAAGVVNAREVVKTTAPDKKE
ncbi:MAG: ATPase, T2SS/T4P/T4SS family [Zetaproteobacteria bacterium]|nr:ATPase, T2SS/T4P/T4SS family [Zetaproteobacteria bacterium]